MVASITGFRRCGESRRRAGAIAVGGVALWMVLDDASAASLGGAVTSVGVVAMLATMLLVKGWQSHLGAGGLSALAGLLALATAAGLLWRAGATPGLRGQGAARPPPRAADAGAAHHPVGLPAGVDREKLLDELRRHFFDLQTAWDHGAREVMSHMTTPDMLDELWAASSAGGGPAHRSEFLSVHAELLLFEQRDAAQIVCVEYSGMVREAPAREATPFREYWMLTRGVEASAGWRLARHQGLL